MRILKPYMKMLTSGSVVNLSLLASQDIQLAINFSDWCGRISHRSEDAPSNPERFLKSIVIDKGDWSITEHINVSVDAIVDRGITHEIVRHRLGAYTQESTRFVNYVKKMPPSFIYPDPEVECPFCIQGHEPTHFQDGWFHVFNERKSKQARCLYDRQWMDLITHCEETYKELLERGWKPQQARSVFPNALSSRIVITFNLRQWRHFFLMRTSAEAHPQMRQVTIPLLQEFKSSISVLYDDIEPNSRQIDNLRKGR
jgi:thymidylate synthase (FAD)